MKTQSLNRILLSGYLFAVGATIIWSGNFAIARGLNESIPPVSLAFWRWAVATAAFLPFAIKALITEWPTIRQHLPYLSITAVLGVTTFNTLVYLASHTTTTLNMSLISITFPVFIIIISRFLYQEPITVYRSVGIVLVAIGVVLLITKGAPAQLLHISFAIGDIWMLVAAMDFAIYSILLKRRPPHLSIAAFQMSTFLLGLLFLFPFYLREHLTTSPVVWQPGIILSVLYIGIFASLSAFLLWNKAVATLGPAKASMIYYTQPLFSGILANIFLDEAISMLHFYSGLLIVLGILLANYEAKKAAQIQPIRVNGP